jgi:peptidoglycan lytic transglycosylase G
VRSKYQPPEVTSLEGLLYPDTYSIGENETDEQILTRLVSTFDQKADEIGLAAPNASGLSPYQTIVAASLIEREAKLDEDRPLISAVIRNRLANGMPLQIDATVCYAKGGCEKSPNASDLGIDSPYNTYRIVGLPPTPISSVTAGSLKAAQSPSSDPYLFYVLSEKNGKHKFATTQEEHDRNVEEARQKGLL